MRPPQPANKTLPWATNIRLLLVAVAGVALSVSSQAVWIGKIHCLGDSLTVGAGPGTRGGGYRWYLKQMLAAKGVEFDFVGMSVEWPGGLTDPNHDGHSGWTSFELGNGRPDGVGNSGTWLLSTRPDIVIVMVGRNDLYPWADTLQNYRKIADQIAAANPNARTLWANVALPREKNAFEILHCEIQDQALISLVSERKAFGQIIDRVDAYRSLSARDDIYSDAIHLNDKGYVALARLFATRLTNLSHLGRP